MATTVENLKENYTLGNAVMDATHLEFLNLLSAAQKSDKQSFAQQFNNLLLHTEAHFEAEEQAMLDTAHLAISEHRAEHTRVLQQFKEMSARLERGRLTLPRAYINEMLPEWFEQHLATMDSELANHLANNPLPTEAPAASTVNQERSSTMAGYTEIKPEDARQMIANEDPLVIDSRDSFSYKEAHIDGALQSHEQLIEHLINNGDHDRPVIVYCYHGNSSKDLAEVLSRAGFKNCYSLAGGFTAWKKSLAQATTA